MASIRSQNTKPEKTLGSILFKKGLRYRKHAADIPGKPDFVFRSRKMAIFVNGDFWHGWRLPVWQKKLQKGYWTNKIQRNRERDRKNYCYLRRRGWKVIIVWEHQLEADKAGVVRKILSVYKGNNKTRLRQKCIRRSDTASYLRPSIRKDPPFIST
jgi:DNA mismatch endonuclease (patch repair protein)